MAELEMKVDALEVDQYIFKLLRELWERREEWPGFITNDSDADPVRGKKKRKGGAASWLFAGNVNINLCRSHPEMAFRAGRLLSVGSGGRMLLVCGSAEHASSLRVAVQAGGGDCASRCRVLVLKSW